MTCQRGPDLPTLEPASRSAIRSRAPSVRSLRPARPSATPGHATPATSAASAFVVGRPDASASLAFTRQPDAAGVGPDRQPSKRTHSRLTIRVRQSEQGRVRGERVSRVRHEQVHGRRKNQSGQDDDHDPQDHAPTLCALEVPRAWRDNGERVTIPSLRRRLNERPLAQGVVGVDLYESPTSNAIRSQRASAHGNCVAAKTSMPIRIQPPITMATAGSRAEARTVAVGQIASSGVSSAISNRRVPSDARWVDSLTSTSVHPSSAGQCLV